jgi:hypothetical protein
MRIIDNRVRLEVVDVSAIGRMVKIEFEPAENSKETPAGFTGRLTHLAYRVRPSGGHDADLTFDIAGHSLHISTDTAKPLIARVEIDAPSG